MGTLPDVEISFGDRVVSETVAIDPVRFAALVAPAITRTFISGMHASGDAGRELVRSYGGRAIGNMIDLRNPLAAGRSIAHGELPAAYRYFDPKDVSDSIDRSVDAGLLDRATDGSVSASARGRSFLADLFALHDRTLTERWPGYVLERLNPLTERLLAEAARTGGAAWAVHAPPHEAPGLGPGIIAMNRLSTLRYHRSDSHAAAWLAAGWTVERIQQFPWARIGRLSARRSRMTPTSARPRLTQC